MPTAATRNERRHATSCAPRATPTAAAAAGAAAPASPSARDGCRGGRTATSRGGAQTSSGPWAACLTLVRRRDRSAQKIARETTGATLRSGHAVGGDSCGEVASAVAAQIAARFDPEAAGDAREAVLEVVRSRDAESRASSTARARTRRVDRKLVSAAGRRRCRPASSRLSGERRRSIVGSDAATPSPSAPG